MERRSAFRPQRVLVVDDTADLRELWRLWLTGWGFTVEEARDGAEAVQKARSRPPDLILMDLAMPVLNGREAMRLLASDPATARVPVLAMTAQTSIATTPDEGQRFIPKPADSDHLLEQIRAALRGSARAFERES
jgi:two-component system KDP operon response regulator KdpE